MNNFKAKAYLMSKTSNKNALIILSTSPTKNLNRDKGDSCYFLFEKNL